MIVSRMLISCYVLGICNRPHLRFGLVVQFVHGVKLVVVLHAVHNPPHPPAFPVHKTLASIHLDDFGHCCAKDGYTSRRLHEK